MLLPFYTMNMEVAGHQTTVGTGNAKNQLDATHMKFIQRSLAQHVSGINMPIIRSTI
jgi:hypothetical protein